MYVSTSDNNPSFANTTLASMIASDNLNDTSSEWYHFLVDFRDNIKDNSTEVVLDDSIMTRYKYRIRDYLKEKQYNYVGLELAFKVVNRFTTDADFNSSVTTVYVPALNYIKTLRKEFNTWKSKYNKL